MTLASRQPIDTQPQVAGYLLQQRPIVALLLTYLISSIALANWLPLGEAVKAALALPAFALVPLLIGHALLRYSPLADDIVAIEWPGRALVEWLVGSVALVAMAFGLYFGDQMPLLQHIGWLALGLAVVAAGLTLRAADKPLPRHVDIGLLLVLATALLLSVTPKIMAAQTTPFPLLGDNFLDAFHFAQPASRLIEHGYLSLENRSHPPGLVILTSVQSQLYNVEPLSFLWMGPFLLFAVFGAGLLLWGRVISRRWTTALLVTAVALFVLTGNPAFSGTPLALRSNRLLFAIFPMALYLIHRLVDDESTTRRAKIEALSALQGVIGVLFLLMSSLGMEARVPVMLVTAAVLGFLLMQVNKRRWHWTGMPALFAVIVGFQVFHVFEGPVYLTGMIIYGLALTLRDARLEAMITVGVCAGLAGFFLVQYTEILSFPADFSASSFVFDSKYEGPVFSVSQRATLLNRFLSPFVIILMLLGAFAFFTKRSGPSGRAVLMAAAIMFGVYLLPDTFAYRTNKGMVPFLAFLVVAGADSIGSYARQALSWLAHDVPLVQEIVQFGIVAAVLPALVIPFLDDIRVPPFRTHNSVITNIEYELADWFDRNTHENVRIVSDNQTMLVLSSLTNTVSISERRFLVREMTDPGRAQMLFIKDTILGASDGCKAYEAVQSLGGSEPPRERHYLDAVGAELEKPQYYVVWTSRTFLWERQEDISPNRAANDDVYPGMVVPFLDSRFFQLEAALSNQAYVFRVLPTPVIAPSDSADPSAVLLSEVVGAATPGACTLTP